MRTVTQIRYLHKKLREAQFFCRHICDKQNLSDLESEKIEFFLSALLSAGRTLVGYVRKTAKQHKKNEHWYKEWESADSDRKLLQQMGKQRDLEVHNEGAKVYSDIKDVPFSQIPLPPTAQLLYGAYDLSSPGAVSAIGQKVYYLKLHGVEHDVIVTCKRYIKLLQQLVDDFDDTGAT